MLVQRSLASALLLVALVVVSFSGLGPIRRAVGQTLVSQSVAVQGDYAYLGVGNRLLILNVSDPSSPQLVGQSAPFPGDVKKVVVNGTWAYVVAQWTEPDYRSRSNLSALDVSQPASPALVGSYSLPADSYHRIEDIALADRYLYAAASYAGLLVLDVADPSHLTQVTSVDTGGAPYHVVVDGHRAYTGDYLAGLKIFDVSTPANPVRIGALHRPGSPFLPIAAAGNSVYAIEESLWIVDPHRSIRSTWTLTGIDVSDPASPQRVSSIELASQVGKEAAFIG